MFLKYFNIIKRTQCVVSVCNVGNWQYSEITLSKTMKVMLKLELKPTYINNFENITYPFCKIQISLFFKFSFF